MCNVYNVCNACKDLNQSMESRTLLSKTNPQRGRNRYEDEGMEPTRLTFHDGFGFGSQLVLLVGQRAVRYEELGRNVRLATVGKNEGRFDMVSKETRYGGEHRLGDLW